MLRLAETVAATAAALSGTGAIVEVSSLKASMGDSASVVPWRLFRKITSALRSSSLSLNFGMTEVGVYARGSTMWPHR